VATYKILIKPSAVKELKKIPQKYLKKIVDKIYSLASEPRPPGCEKLTNEEVYHIRHGIYGILYTIEDDNLIIIAIKVGHRKNVYK
jgi:mRNA interferase RelE/StbE